MKTYKILSVLIIFLFIFTACNNDDDQTTTYDSVGLITGVDIGTCACCGNWRIEIEDEPDIRQFVDLPSNSEIELSTASFPISVSLNWNETDFVCDFILITEIIEN